jgi:hypothetical protein
MDVLRLLFDPRGRINRAKFWLALAAALILVAFSGTSLTAQPFQPIRRLTTWYTDRTPVDIEIVGSTSLLPEWHKAEPDRALRFRLERAYVQTLLADRGPDFTIVGFGFDTETGLPDSLITAVAQKGRFHEDIPGVPVVSWSDRARRTLALTLKSDESAATLVRMSGEVARCRGAAVRRDLLSYEWAGREGCRRPVYPKGSRYIAVYDQLMLLVECQEEQFPGLGCTLHFPLDGFAVEVAFHRDRLLNWNEVVAQASSFLKSKQYLQ